MKRDLSIFICVLILLQTTISITLNKSNLQENISKKLFSDNSSVEKDTSSSIINACQLGMLYYNNKCYYSCDEVNLSDKAIKLIADNFSMKCVEISNYSNIENTLNEYNNLIFYMLFSKSSCINSCSKIFKDCSCLDDCVYKGNCCSDYKEFCTFSKNNKDNKDCDDNCLSCHKKEKNVGGDCFLCKENYYLNYNTRKCEKTCSALSKSKDDINNIDHDALEYILYDKNNLCIKKTSLDNCLEELTYYNNNYSIDLNKDNNGNAVTSFTKCKKCLYEYYLMDNKCIKQCPLGYKADNRTMTCIKNNFISNPSNNNVLFSLYTIFPSHTCVDRCGESNIKINKNISSNCSCEESCLRKGNCCVDFDSICLKEIQKERGVLCLNKDYKNNACLKCFDNAIISNNKIDCECSSGYYHDVNEDKCVLSRIKSAISLNSEASKIKSLSSKLSMRKDIINTETKIFSNGSKEEIYDNKKSDDQNNNEKLECDDGKIISIHDSITNKSPIKAVDLITEFNNDNEDEDITKDNINEYNFENNNSFTKNDNKNNKNNNNSNLIIEKNGENKKQSVSVNNKQYFEIKEFLKTLTNIDSLIKIPNISNLSTTSNHMLTKSKSKSKYNDGDSKDCSNTNTQLNINSNNIKKRIVRNSNSYNNIEKSNMHIDLKRKNTDKENEDEKKTSKPFDISTNNSKNEDFEALNESNETDNKANTDKSGNKRNNFSVKSSNITPYYKNYRKRLSLDFNNNLSLKHYKTYPDDLNKDSEEITTTKILEDGSLSNMDNKPIDYFPSDDKNEYNDNENSLDNTHNNLNDHKKINKNEDNSHYDKYHKHNKNKDYGKFLTLEEENQIAKKIKENTRNIISKLPFNKKDKITNINNFYFVDQSTELNDSQYASVFHNDNTNSKVIFKQEKKDNSNNNSENELIWKDHKSSYDYNINDSDIDEFKSEDSI